MWHTTWGTQHGITVGADLLRAEKVGVIPDVLEWECQPDFTGRDVTSALPNLTLRYRAKSQVTILVYNLSLAVYNITLSVLKMNMTLIFIYVNDDDSTRSVHFFWIVLLSMFQADILKNE